MSDTERITLDTSEATDSLEALRGEMEAFVSNDLSPLATAVDDTFTSINRSIAENLSEAAEQGKLSVKSLVNDVLTDLARLAAEEFVRKPLENVLGDVFGGARAGGGLVAPGTPYLVGERGPELFVPAQSGGIASPSARPVTVNISMTSGAGDALGRSEAQLAGALRRALTRAERNG